MSQKNPMDLFENAPTQAEIARCVLEQIHEAETASNMGKNSKIAIRLPRKYSHFIVKKVLHLLGYTPITKKPELEFKIKRL